MMSWNDIELNQLRQQEMQKQAETFRLAQEVKKQATHSQNNWFASAKKTVQTWSNNVTRETALVVEPKLQTQE